MNLLLNDPVIFQSSLPECEESLLVPSNVPPVDPPVESSGDRLRKFLTEWRTPDAGQAN